jgi:phosphatidate cytidylyltransferase
MLKRVLTAVIGLPILIFLVNAGGFWLLGGLLAVSLVGLYEFYHTLSKQTLAVHVVGYIFTALYYVLVLHTFVSAFLLILFAALVMSVLACLVVLYNKITLLDCVTAISGFFYIPFLFSFIFLVREHSQGAYFVWLIFTSALGCDTCAYFAGRAFGKHKFVNTPSPSKSWEGAVGGVLGAACIGLLYGLFFTNAGDARMVLNAALVSLAGGVFAQFGDLFASAVKRHANIKDFGMVFPGHGGVLDRFDSVLATAPVVYMVMIAMIRFK